MTAFSAKRRRAAEVRVSAENSRFENDKFRLRGTERGDCPVPTPINTKQNEFKGDKDYDEEHL